MSKTITIGGASGFWGDAAMATPQLLASESMDYIVYDYLAEITMSIMARARAVDERKGYATDFISAVLKPNLVEISRQGIKLVANAGGVNPVACAEQAKALISELGLDLTVAVVLGDDMISRREEFAAAGITEMFSGREFPDPHGVASINAYLGAFPIAEALNRGADIVITGRCVDSAVTLGACIHAFGWGREDYDKMAQGSLAGHILECGTQATGGNFTDWESIVETLPEAGYPIAEVSESGEVFITKPQGTGGTVSVGTVAEQLLYEIGDPQAYILPDVVCDFSNVRLDQVTENRVALNGAQGHGAPAGYKCSATYADGFRAGHIWTFSGRNADIKAEHFSAAVFSRARKRLQQLHLPDFTETSCEVIGAESQYGTARRIGRVREVDVKLAVRHPSAGGIDVMLKEMVGMALTAPPGLMGFAGARAKPSPVVRLFSMIVPKNQVEITVECNGESFLCNDPVPVPPGLSDISPHKPVFGELVDECVSVSLERLAWGRSGDKGNKANIGIIARESEFIPYIAAQITSQRVEELFTHFLDSGQKTPVQRFYMPGPRAFNFLLHDVLGGGGIASLRADPQGKGYAQVLLAQLVQVPRQVAGKFNLEID